MDQKDLDQQLLADKFSRQVSTVTLFGVEVSTVQVYATTISFAVFLLMWIIFGFFAISPWMIVFFVLSTLLNVYNMFKLDTKTNTSVETAIEEMQNTIIRVEGFMGVVVLVFIATFFIKWKSYGPRGDSIFLIKRYRIIGTQLIILI